MYKVLAIVAALSGVFSVSASTTSVEWDFDNNNVGVNGTTNEALKSSSYYGYNGYDSFSTTDGTTSVEVTGWSDSIAIDSNGTSKERYDQKVVAADLYYWGDSNGWGVVNTDESASSSPDHSIDNYSHDAYYSDQDMVLLSFSQEVNLEEITVGWFSDGDNNNLDVGVIAIDQSQVDQIEGGNSTWDDIYNEVDMSTVAYSGSHGSEHYYALNQDLGESQFWLVGLYNEMAHCDYDAFKLMGVTASVTSGTPPGGPIAVSEPSAIAIFALGLAFLFRQQKATKKFKLHV